MVSHIGEIVKIANPHTRGLTNDHVSVCRTADLVVDLQPPTPNYNVYAREKYNVGRGPRPIPRYGGAVVYEKEILEGGERPRGWGHVDTIFQNATLDEAMRVAEEEAKRRGVVLYLDDSNTTIKWRPDGWQPQEG